MTAGTDTADLRLRYVAAIYLSWFLGGAAVALYFDWRLLAGVLIGIPVGFAAALFWIALEIMGKPEHVELFKP